LSERSAWDQKGAKNWSCVGGYWPSGNSNAATRRRWATTEAWSW
jgi:hypothetical protein